MIRLLAICSLMIFTLTMAVAADPSFADFDRRAAAGEKLSVVFFGASLTWGANATDQATTSYRAEIARRLEERYPAAHFHYKDGAIGGTGSQLGVFRVERDVLRWKPDLVFLDFSANDDIYSDDPESLASYEAIVRRLVGDEHIPVVQVAFPFKWNIDAKQIPSFKRLAAHHAIADAYGCGWGDAISLVIDRVGSGKADIEAIWNTDPVHPGDAGYLLFAEAAWNGYSEAVAAKRTGHVPERTINPATYTSAKRVRLDSLGTLPAGWRTGRPSLTSIFYDFQMSRWMDGIVILANRADQLDAQGKPVKGADGKVVRVAQPTASLKLTVKASTILLFGEASVASGHFRVLVDGKPTLVKWGANKGSDQFEGNLWKGYGHMVVEAARDLDPAVAHTLEIEPVLAADQDQELRFESVCVAGGAATAEFTK